MTEAQIIRASIIELRRMLATLQDQLQTLERDRAIIALQRDSLRRSSAAN